MKTDLKRQIKKLNAARAQYNPLRGITIQKVVGLLEAGERGEYADLQWTYRMIEKRDAVLRALVRRRSAALMKLDHDIKIPPEDQLPQGATQAMAEAQQIALRELYAGIGNLKAAIKFLALAEFRGYAHLEKSFREASSTNPEQLDALYPVAQWYWCRDGLDGDWMFDPDLHRLWRSAEAVDPKNLVVREVDDPVNEIALIAFLRKNMSQKDWDGFVEVFGIPDIFFTMPQGLSKEDQAEWMATAERMAGDGRGALPFGAGVEAVGGDVRGINPFKEHLNYQDTMMVLAGTGGKLTMLSEATGIGGGATDAHEDAFNELAQAEAVEISELLRESIDAPFLDAKFQGQPHLAYFEIAAKDQEDVAQLIANAKTLFDAGIEIDVDDLAERTGYSLTRVRQALGVGKQALGIRPEDGGMKNRRSWVPKFLRNRQSKAEKQQAALRANARKALALAVADDLTPVVDRLIEILDTVDDDQLLDALEEFQTSELPELAAQVLDDPTAADAIADTLSANFFNGLAEGKVK